MQRPIQAIYHNPQMHWVGDGFAVHNLLAYDQRAASASPFLMLDYAPPRTFSPRDTAVDSARGVGPHPHRGFATVTIAYQGEVAHRDSAGNGGVIRADEVQWMVAGRGILHEEFHSKAFSQAGGVMEMVQLWVNHRAVDKMVPSSYQALSEIPVHQSEGVTVRVIAGQWQAKDSLIQGVAQTYSPINLWDIRLAAGASLRFTPPAAHSALCLVMGAAVTVNGQAVEPVHLVHFEQTSGAIELAASSAAKVLFMGGEVLNEPVVGYGPFVMNSRDEIVQAQRDFMQGAFGTM